MNDLIIKLSELLEISVDSAKYLYPELREQFIIYKVSELASWLVVIAAVIIGSILFFKNIDKVDRLEDKIRDSQDEQYIKQLTKERDQISIKYRNRIIYTLIIGVIISVICLLIPYFFATDLLLIKELL